MLTPPERGRVMADETARAEARQQYRWHHYGQYVFCGCFVPILLLVGACLVVVLPS
jgi:hypothetical protein